MFQTTFSITDAERASFRELLREVVEWRLAEYLGPEREDDHTGTNEEPAVHIGLSRGPELWQPYQRRQIPHLFGLKFSTGNWNAGFVRVGHHIFLLVTLAKETMGINPKYEDRFLGADKFQWQSQRQTTQSKKAGREIRDHEALGISVHLFVRRDAKTANGAGASFYYCGDVQFANWQGEKPITVQWRLLQPLPSRLQELFRVSRSE